MLLRFIIYLVFILFIGTALYYWLNENKPTNNATEIDSCLIDCVNEWRSTLLSEGFDSKPVFTSLRSIKIKKLSEEMVGITHYYKKTIEIDPAILTQGTFALRATIYHELGHYAFGLNHESCKIMSTTILSEKEYKEHWDDMKNEYIELIRKQDFETHLP